MNYRNRDLLDLARFAPQCFGCMAYNDGTVVAAHANHVWKGAGMKAPDFAWAALDLKCHSRLDQGSDWTREERRAFWEAAYWRTQNWLWSSGLICVSPEHVREGRPEPVKRRVKKSRPMQGRGFDKRFSKSLGGIVSRKGEPA